MITKFSQTNIFGYKLKIQNKNIFPTLKKLKNDLFLKDAIIFKSCIHIGA